MTYKSDLTALGWDTSTTAKATQAVRDFQNGYCLAGAPLFVDGSPGPKTLAAIAHSLKRKAERLPTASTNFSFTEFRCACGGYSDCKRIWVDRDLILALEKYRTLVGPLFIVRGCRCPRENARVGGAKRSQHLYGRAADLPIYDISLAKIKTLKVVRGAGLYDWKDARGARQVPRHLDVRPENTVLDPAQWDYGNATQPPLKPQPQPLTTAPSAPVLPAPAPSQPVKVGEVVPGTKRLAISNDFDKATITELQHWIKRTFKSNITVDGVWGPSSRGYLEHVLNHIAQGWTVPGALAPVTRTTKPGSSSTHTVRLNALVKVPKGRMWTPQYTTPAIQRFLNQQNGYA